MFTELCSIEIKDLIVFVNKLKSFRKYVFGYK